jgi:hypothetical protein
MPEEFITWVQFGSFPIMVFLVQIIVKHTKDMADQWAFIRKIGTFAYGYLMAVVLQIMFLIGLLLMAEKLPSVGIMYQSIVLILVNSLFVELSAAKASDGNIRGPGIHNDGGIGG